MKTRDAATRLTDLGFVLTDAHHDDSVSKGAIYDRASANKPVSHYSLEWQVNFCWDHCEQQDCDIPFLFTGKAESGNNTDRFVFQEERMEEATDA